MKRLVIVGFVALALLMGTACGGNDFDIETATALLPDTLWVTIDGDTVCGIPGHLVAEKLAEGVD